jgi:hypothetical protein
MCKKFIKTGEQAVDSERYKIEERAMESNSRVIL